jgi:hypothetical protein
MSIESNVLENGAYVPRRIPIEHILNHSRAEPDHRLQRPRRANPGLGLLSTTLIKSSMTKWILPASIRRKEIGDLLFVGENFVRIKEIFPDGSMRHVATLTDFPARNKIRAAAVLGEPVEAERLDRPRGPFIKLENRVIDPSEDMSALRSFPPQILVLALDMPELRFVVADSFPSGAVRFRQTTVPLPKHRVWMETPGKFIAVDPFARAFAVAAGNDSVMLYSVKERALLEAEFAMDHDDLNPIVEEWPLDVGGTILDVKFLNPGPSDGTHVILIVVTAVGDRTRISCFEWEASRGMRDIRIVVDKSRLADSERP